MADAAEPQAEAAPNPTPAVNLKEAKIIFIQGRSTQPVYLKIVANHLCNELGFTFLPYNLIQQRLEPGLLARQDAVVQQTESALSHIDRCLQEHDPVFRTYLPDELVFEVFKGQIELHLAEGCKYFIIEGLPGNVRLFNLFRDAFDYQFTLNLHITSVYLKNLRGIERTVSSLHQYTDNGDVSIALRAWTHRFALWAELWGNPEFSRSTFTVIFGEDYDKAYRAVRNIVVNRLADTMINAGVADAAESVSGDDDATDDQDQVQDDGAEGHDAEGVEDAEAM